MKKIVQARLSDGRAISLFTEKIIAVVPVGNNQTAVYCVGNFPNSVGIVWTIESDYKTFMSLFD